MTLKQELSNMLMGYASPTPYMYRDNWEPVARYGVNRGTLANVGRGIYGGWLDNLASGIDPRNNPLAYEALNNLRNRNDYYMTQNEMRYNPNFFIGLE